MGSEASKDFRDNSLLSNDLDSYDFDGLKASEDSSIENEYYNKEKEEIDYSGEKKIKEHITSSQINKVPVLFEWDQGGNSVYVTGNFCNWKQFFLMEKNSNGIYTLTLNLNKGLIQYKFKVDNEWKYNDKFPIINDGGNKNNYIDTTNWEISAETSDTENNTNTYSNTDLSSKHKFNKSFILQNNYTNIYPQINDMNNFAPKIPEQFKLKNRNNKLNKQNINGNNSLFYPEGEDLIGEKYFNKKFNKIKHEQINHVSYNLKNIKKRPIVCSIISRYRLKFTNFVYYK